MLRRLGQRCSILDVIQSVVDGYRIAARLVRINGILRNRVIDQAKIVFHLDSLRSFSGPKKPWDGNGGKQRNPRDYNHDFDQSESCRCEADSPPFASASGREFHCGCSASAALNRADRVPWKTFN
jgi:hypothetical protein